MMQQIQNKSHSFQPSVNGGMSSISNTFFNYPFMSHRKFRHLVPHQQPTACQQEEESEQQK
jgi:hypothetical protein